MDIERKEKNPDIEYRKAKEFNIIFWLIKKNNQQQQEEEKPTGRH